MNNDAWNGRYADTGSGTVATSSVTGCHGEGIAPHHTIETDLGLVGTTTKTASAFAPTISTQSATGTERKALTYTDLTAGRVNA